MSNAPRQFPLIRPADLMARYAATSSQRVVHSESDSDESVDLEASQPSNADATDTDDLSALEAGIARRTYTTHTGNDSDSICIERTGKEVVRKTWNGKKKSTKKAGTQAQTNKPRN